MARSFGFDGSRIVRGKASKAGLLRKARESAPLEIQEARATAPGRPSVLVFKNIMRSADKESGVSWYSPGSLYLASSLRREGVRTSVSRFRIGDSPGESDLVGMLDEGVTLVAITLCEDYIHEAAELARFIRGHSRAFIALGGPMATLTPEHALAHVPDANIVVRGDGEEALPQIARILGGSGIDSELEEDVLFSLASMKGILFWKPGLLVSGRCDKINEHDMDSTGPDFSILGKDDVSSGLVLFTSRGCRNNCIFCTTPGRGKFRARRAELVVSDLKAYEKRLEELFPRGVPEECLTVSFNDDDFFTDQERGSKILDFFRSGRLRIGFVQAGVNSFFKGGSIDKRIYRSMSSECFSRPKRDKTDIFIGTESFSDRELKNLRKGYSLDRVRQLVDFLCRRGVKQSHHLILSNPWSRKEDMEESLGNASIFSKEFGNCFGILEPCIPNMVSLFPSESHSKLVKDGRPDSLVIREVMKIEGFPELDYPLVSYDLPIDSEAARLSGMLRKKIENGEPLFRPLSREEEILENLLEKSVIEARGSGVPDARETSKAPDTEESRVMASISKARPAIGAMDDCLFYLGYRKEKELLKNGNNRKARDLESLISRHEGYQREIEQIAGEEACPDRIYQSPDRLVVMVTHNCQLRCRYCSVRKFPARMNEKTLFKAVDLLFTSSKNELQLQFFGGEPLLEFDLIRKGVDYARRKAGKTGKRVKFLVTTNGLLLDREKARYLRDNGFLVEFSIDGDMETQLMTRKASDGRNYFSVIENNLRTAAEEGLDLYTISVVTPWTVGSLFENVRFLASKGHRRIQINYSLGCFWDKNSIQRLLDELIRVLGFLESEGRDIELINLTRTRKEPVVLNSEVTVDCDGEVYLETGICLEEDFNEMKRKFSVGRIGEIEDIRRVAGTRFRNLRILSKAYGENTDFRRIILNNIELGKLIERFLSRGMPGKKRLEDLDDRGKEDLNFSRFLAMKIPRYDLYPPLEAYRKMDIKEIKESWMQAFREMKTGSIPDYMGMYFNIPFCISKCLYCFCHSRKLGSSSELTRYVRWLINAIRMHKDVIRETKFDTLYFGGGTPSIMTAEQIDSIFRSLEDMRFKKGFQANVECSPSTFTQNKADVLRKNGVNRITIGIQSSDPVVLRKNNRFQTIRSIRNSMNIARKSGFETVDIDVIGGLPGQDLESFRKTIEFVIDLEPDMIHIYPFCHEEDTPFKRKGLTLSYREALRKSEMTRKGRAMLLDHGYREIGFDCFGSKESDQNLQEVQYYGYNSSILGFGSLARSHIFGRCFYMQDSYFENSRDCSYKGIDVGLDEEMRKFIIWNLRKGIDKKLFRKLFGKDIMAEFGGVLRPMVDNGLMSHEGDLLVSTGMTRQDSLVFSKMIYGRKMLDLLNKTFRKEYDPGHEYSRDLDRIAEPEQ